MTDVIAKVKASKRKPDLKTFHCSVCGREIKEKEKYTATVESEEFFEREKGELVVTPVNVVQTFVICKKCKNRQKKHSTVLKKK
jgi:hypothetical protein